MTPVTPRRLLLAAVGAALGGSLWWRKHPSACPYGQRFWVEMPHPLITRRRLLTVLAPAPAERMLEIGPGTGYYTLAVARALSGGGRLEIFDIQREMLDHTMRRAAEQRLDNIAATQGDARQLPYPDGSFDAVYMITVLGEIPDRQAALRQVARVLRADGRLIVGELLGDPHWVSPRSLIGDARAAGLEFVRRSGSRLGYFAVFTRRAGGEDAT